MEFPWENICLFHQHNGGIMELITTYWGFGHLVEWLNGDCELQEDSEYLFFSGGGGIRPEDFFFMVLRLTL